RLMVWVSIPIGITRNRLDGDRIVSIRMSLSGWLTGDAARNEGGFVKTRQYPRRALGRARRALAALALATAATGFALGVSSPAQAASTYMCSATPVPAGWVVTQAQTNSGNCGPHLLYWITNDLYNGMHICSATPVPAGWLVTQAMSNSGNCGPHLSYWITRLG
uniref:hypothetical protein n=1 Tax=Micromonospora sp. RP3T TaxID=2135446 RepID=UPI003D73338D